MFNIATVLLKQVHSTIITRHSQFSMVARRTLVQNKSRNQEISNRICYFYYL